MRGHKGVPPPTNWFACRFWAGVVGSCWVTDSEGGHRGLRCHGATSGQCIFPVYGGSLPVTRTCGDHSNEVIVLQPSFRLFDSLQ